MSENIEMKKTTQELLKEVSDWDENALKGAYNIREDSGCAARKSTKNIKIESKKDAPGIVIHISAETKGESVYIPACITHSGVDDLVYNDFMIEDGADVIIIAGCGVHRFFVGKNAKVVYREKHLGTGKSKGAKKIDPVTDIIMAENSYLEMDTTQLGGVSSSDRKTL